MKLRLQIFIHIILFLDPLFFPLSNFYFQFSFSTMTGFFFFVVFKNSSTYCSPMKYFLLFSRPQDLFYSVTDTVDQIIYYVNGFSPKCVVFKKKLILIVTGKDAIIVFQTDFKLHVNFNKDAAASVTLVINKLSETFESTKFLFFVCIQLLHK